MQSGTNAQLVKEYLDVVKPEVLAIAGSSHDKNMHPVDNTDNLDELEKEIIEAQEKHVAAKLKALNYQLTSPELVAGVVPSPRLEEVGEIDNSVALSTDVVITVNSVPCDSLAPKTRSISGKRQEDIRCPIQGDVGLCQHCLGGVCDPF